MEYGKWRQGSGLMLPLIKGLACYHLNLIKPEES